MKTLQVLVRITVEVDRDYSDNELQNMTSDVTGYKLCGMGDGEVISDRVIDWSTEDVYTDNSE